MSDQWTIVFYRDRRGDRPVADFIRSLRSNPSLQAKVLRTIDLLAEFGTSLSMPHSRAMTGYDFRELRVKQGSDIARILYSAAGGRRMILLHGFVKKSQKTSQRELELGRSRLAEFLTGEL